MQKDRAGKKNILMSPVTVLSFMALGVLAGVYFKEFSIKMMPLGDIFLLLLKMCVYPILVTSVICSFGRLVRSELKGKAIRNMLVIFAASFVAISLLALYGSVIMGPGRNLPQEAQDVLGRVLLDSNENEISFDAREHLSVYGLIKSIIPGNIFEALGKGENLQILFFSMLVGIAAGLAKAKVGDTLLELSEASFQIFLHMINWTMLALPFGLFFLLAGQIASTGFTILLAMIKYIGFLYGLSVFIIMANALIISISKKANFFMTFAMLKDPLLVSFGTRSTLASIPVSIQSLTKRMNIHPELVNLVIPLGSILARFSMIILYSSAAIFTAQLYAIDLNQVEMIKIAFLSIIVAIAGAGTPAVAALSMISIVLTPFGLPSTAMVILLISIMPIVDPILTMANVHTNCTLAVLIDKSGE